MHDELPSEGRTAAFPPPSALRRISWGAILAGVAIALSLQLLFNLLGIGIGASTIDVADGSTPGSGLAIGAGVWFAVSALLALFAGGLAAGRLAGVPNSKDGMLHGFATWSITTLATVFMLTSAMGSIIGGSASALGKTMSLGGQGVQNSSSVVGSLMTRATGITSSEVMQQAGGIVSDPRFQQFASQVVESGQVSPQSRADLVQVVADNQGISQEQASSEVSNWQQKLTEARAQTKSTAIQAADSTAAGVSKTALWSFGALLLGAIAATIGGSLGSPTFLFPARVAQPVLS